VFQEYFYQKLLKSDKVSPSYDWRKRDVFLTHSVCRRQWQSRTAYITHVVQPGLSKSSISMTCWWRYIVRDVLFVVHIIIFSYLLAHNDVVTSQTLHTECYAAFTPDVCSQIQVVSTCIQSRSQRRARGLAKSLCPLADLVVMTRCLTQLCNIITLFTESVIVWCNLL